MCELFALSSDKPSNVTFSLGVFSRRGGGAGPHKDGWGLAFKEGRDFRLIKEAAAAASSACLRFIETHEFRSEIVLSHLRLASMPLVTSYTNTHPFSRELFGYSHVFAHNGTMPGVMDDIHMAPTWNFALGDTDSERAFCALIDRLRHALAPEEIFDLHKKLPVIQAWANELTQHGVANFLLSDSEYLYAHRSTRLYYLERQCGASPELFGSDSLQGTMVPSHPGLQRVSLIATQPVTADGSWLPLPEGKVTVFHRGRRVCETL